LAIWLKKVCRPVSLGLTFTRNAADEMRSKAKACIGRSSKSGITAHPFMHSASGSSRTAAVTLKSCMEKNSYDSSGRSRKRKKVNLPTGLLLREISLAKNNLISVKEFRDLYGDDQTMNLIADIYQAYDLEKQQKMMLDFDDLLVETNQLMGQKPVRQRYQQAYSHILVDEFQDTSPAQLEILKKLVNRNGSSSFYATGDDAQSIFSFTGASLGNILNFSEIFPNSKQFILEY
jgi:DNA helicase-2/ATP-dependent DNA helicase PcrA